MMSLDITAYLASLIHDLTPIPEPQNVDVLLRLPTEREGELTPKYGYNEELEKIHFLVRQSYDKPKCQKKKERKLP